MTTTTQIAETGTTLLIPLNRLKKSPRNVRKTPHPQADIEALAASIAAKGLLQNLVVEPELDGEGEPTGYYLVTIGEGRRLAHMLRAKRKEIKKTEPVRCVIDTDHNAQEISLAENVIRSAMHPADQYEAFAKLHNEDGMAAEDIAARFGVTPTVVKQRLKLGALSPKLMQAYRDGALNLDQLTAFTITDDHARQEQVWDALPDFNRSRSAIMDALAEGQVASDDRRALFIGAEAYEAAGGLIVRDLFDEDGGGYFADAALLSCLVREKLAEVAATVQAEGWKWVTVEPAFDYEMTAGMRRVRPEAVPPADEDETRLAELEAQYQAFCDAHDGDDSDEAMAEALRFEQEIDAIRGREDYRAEHIAIAGAFVSLDHDGEPRIERGFVLPEDWAEAKDDRTDGEADAAKANGTKPLSDKLVAELTAYRTAGLRNALAEHSAMALTAVVHALAAATFYPWSGDVTCLGFAPCCVSLTGHASGIDTCPAMAAIAERHASWERRLPEDAAGLWDFVAGLDMAGQVELLAHCASLTLDAVILPKQPRGGAASAHADMLAQRLGLDMAATWTPTVASYRARVERAYPRSGTRRRLARGRHQHRHHEKAGDGRGGRAAPSRNRLAAATAAHRLRRTG
jgi:ParB family chromosome partitioning protein